MSTKEYSKYHKNQKGLEMKIIILLILFYTSLTASNIAVIYYNNNYQYYSSVEVHLNKFPLNNYVKNMSVIDFNDLEYDRGILNELSDGLGDSLLYKYAELYHKNNPITLSNLSMKIEIANLYKETKENISYRENEIYTIIGNYFLMQSAFFIENIIKNDMDLLDDEKIIEAIDELRKNKIYIDIKSDLWYKVKMHSSKCLTYWYDFFIEKDNISSFIMDSNERSCEYLVDRAYNKITNPVVELLDNDDIEEKVIFKEYKNFYRSNDGYINSTYKLKDLQRDEYIGYVIWLKRANNMKGVKAKYITYLPNTAPSIRQKLKSFDKKRYSKVLLTAGGFTNQFLQPEGLTADDGIIINSIISPTKDALVIFEKSGGIRVLDLTKNNLRLPNGQEINPRKSLSDYGKLVKWIKNEKLSVFQTQLLAYSDRLSIDELLAPKTKRERRILVLASNQKGQVFNIIFHIEKQYSLATISKIIFQTIKKRHLKVEAMLNLDVGSYNILEVYDTNENRLSKPTAPTSKDKASNLIIFYTD